MATPSGGFKHFWYELRDDEGIPRPNTQVYVYESVIDDIHYPYPATTQVNLYDTTNTTTLTQPVSTTSAGIFEFYIRDEMWPSGGYAWDDRIRIQWLHEGSDKYADRVMLWGEFYPVDETDTNVDKNKAISNQLGCEIDTHKDFVLDADILPTSASCASGGVHGLEALRWDYPGSDSVSASNKVLSNNVFCDLMDYVADAAFPYVDTPGLIFKQIKIQAVADPIEYTAVWTASGSDYYANVRHYMNFQTPYASTLWDVTTKQIIEPSSIQFISARELRVWSATDDNMIIVIAHQGNTT